MSNQKSKAVASVGSTALATSSGSRKSTSEKQEEMKSEYTCSYCSVIFTTKRPYLGDRPKCIKCRNGNYKPVCIDCDNPPVDMWHTKCSDCNQKDIQKNIQKHGIKNETITYQCEVRNVNGKKYYPVSLPYEEDENGRNEYSDYKCPTAGCKSSLLVSSKPKHNQKIIMELQYNGYMDSLSGFRFILTDCYCGCCYSKINHTEWEEDGY